MKYLISGYCLVPMKAEIEVDAETPDLALAIAMTKWEQDRRALIVERSEDEGAADDWRPSVEAMHN